MHFIDSSACSGVGAFFSAHETPPDTPFVRVSFAAAEEAMVEGFRRLGNVLRRRREAGAAPARSGTM